MHSINDEILFAYGWMDVLSIEHVYLKVTYIKHICVFMNSFDGYYITGISMLLYVQYINIWND